MFRKFLVLMLAVFSLTTLATASASATVIERIIATVNDSIITQTDMDKFADQLKGGGLTDDLLIPDEETKKAILGDRKKLLDVMIDEKVIDSEVRRQDLTVSIERVEQEIRSVAKRNNLSRDALKAAIQERGVKFSDYQDFIKRGLERQSLIEKAIVSKIKISEDDVQATFLAQSGSRGEDAFEYTLAHIFFTPQKGGAAKARERAQFVLSKLREGSSFETLASEYSEDPNFSAGGVLGTFRTGEILKEFERAAQKLQPNETSGIIETKTGLHIIKVLRKKLIPDPRLDGAKDKIRNQLYEKAYKKQFQSWLEQLRSEAFIRINKK